jgi:hypothetical protein
MHLNLTCNLFIWSQGRTYKHLVNSNCKWNEEKREEFEGKTALKWRKPTYVSACHLDIAESQYIENVAAAIHKQDVNSLESLSCREIPLINALRKKGAERCRG